MYLFVININFVLEVLNESFVVVSQSITLSISFADI